MPTGTAKIPVSVTGKTQMRTAYPIPRARLVEQQCKRNQRKRQSRQANLNHEDSKVCFHRAHRAGSHDSAHRWRSIRGFRIGPRRRRIALGSHAWFVFRMVNSVRRASTRTIRTPGILTCSTRGKLKHLQSLSYEQHNGSQQAQTGRHSCAGNPHQLVRGYGRTAKSEGQKKCNPRLELNPLGPDSLPATAAYNL